MTLPDLIEISLGNMWRMKLRAFLTIAGVVIAVGAFVAMLSFGAGNQQYIEDRFNELGLFHTMQVYPHRDSSDIFLDQAAIEMIAELPGVNLAYPFDDFEATITIGDTSFERSAQALPAMAAGSPLYNQLLAGRMFDSDSDRVAVVDESVLEALGLEDPDSVLGESLVVTSYLSTLDSGLAAIIRDEDGARRERLSQIEFDSLFSRDFVEDLARNELNDAARLFFDGYMNHRMAVSETLIVCGVVKEREHGRARIRPVIVPRQAASHLNSGGLSSDPTDLLAALNSGRLFARATESDQRSFPQVTLDLAMDADHATLIDTLEARGYRAFSYAQEFEEIRQAFIYFDLGLGVIGLIALITASLGIINTMVMSILERTREIGILKSLGASKGEIRLLFLVESGVIGSLGAILGILLGWVVSRITSAIFQAIMAHEGVEEIDLFALPWWLILIALALGLSVSVAAGLYPAARASRVDPVEALRAD